MKRIFIVGLARSGTTLLQSMLGNTNEIFSLPETHFFSKTIPKQDILRVFHKISIEDKMYVESFVGNQNKSNLFTEYQKSPRNTNHWVRYLIDTIDNLSYSEGKEIWIEKTPLHIYYIDLISKNTENTFFIHTVREPIANIAALYDVSKKYPDKFRQPSLEASFKRYIKELSITEKQINKQNNIHIYYEDLIHKPENTLRKLCDFTGVTFKESMLNHTELTARITTNDEKWKINNKKNDLKSVDKTRERLTKEELHWLKRKIAKVNNSILKHYVN